MKKYYFFKKLLILKVNHSHNLIITKPKFANRKMKNALRTKSIIFSNVLYAQHWIRQFYWNMMILMQILNHSDVSIYFTISELFSQFSRQFISQTVKSFKNFYLSTRNLPILYFITLFVYLLSLWLRDTHMDIFIFLSWFINICTWIFKFTHFVCRIHSYEMNGIAHAHFKNEFWQFI